MPPFLLLAAVLMQSESAPSDSTGSVEIRPAIEKSLVFLESKGLDWETKKCVSCHHGPWMMWSAYEAKKRGFTVNDESLDRVRRGAIKAYTRHPTMRPTSRDLLNDLAINVVYLTFGMGASGTPDEETAHFYDKAAAHLLEQQKEDGSWKVLITKKLPEGKTTSFLMPPLIDADDVTTMWALLALCYRQPSGISPEVLNRSREDGLKFLKETPASDTLQSLVLRVMLYQRLGNLIEAQAYAKELLALQKDDGGWSQTAKLKSDSLGTGQALVALADAGVPSHNPSWAKGAAYLLKHQKEDGSWFVVSRAYEPPEFSSYIGTAWATRGLLRALPENESTPVSEPANSANRTIHPPTRK